jgi:hypothetical protein
MAQAQASASTPLFVELLIQTGFSLLTAAWQKRYSVLA